MNWKDLCEAACRCDYIKEQCPGGPDESFKLSPHSPGIIVDAEQVARTLFSPYHINESTQKIAPSAFNDVETRGLSVDRLNYTTQEEIIERAQTKIQRDRASGKNRGDFYAIYTASVAELRAKLYESQRLYYIYDTSLQNNISHADICQHYKVPSGTPKSQKMKIRNIIKSLFQVADTELKQG